MPDQQFPPERRLPGGWQPAPVPELNAGNAPISLSRVAAMLRRHLRLVALMAIAGLALGLFMASRETSQFRAAATVRLAGERRALTNEQTGGIDAKSVDPVVSLAGLISSRGVLREVVDTLGLQLSPVTPTTNFDYSVLRNVVVPEGGLEDTLALKFTPTSVEGRLGPRRATAVYGQPLDLGLVRMTITGASATGDALLAVQPKEVVVDWLAGEITVTKKEETDLLTVSFVSSDPRVAQMVVNTAVRVFMHVNVRSAQDIARRKREVLAEQLAQTDSQLEQAQARLAAFRSRQQFASSQSQLLEGQTAMAARQTAIEQAMTDRQTISALLKSTEQGPEASRRSALQSLAAAIPTAAGSYQQFLTLQLQLDSMTTGPYAAAETNPDVIRLKDRINQVGNEIVRTAKGQITVLDQKVQVLNATKSVAGSGLQSLPAAVEEETQLNRAVELFSGSADKLRDEFQQAKMAEAVQVGDVDLVDLAALPYVPLWGTGPIKVAVGLLLGLLLGCGGAFLLEAMNKSIRRPEEIEGTLQIPGLAVIPPLSPNGSHSVARPRIAGLLRGGKRQPVTDRSKVGPTGTTSQPFSVGTEAFRMLRTSLIWSEPGADLKTLVVTSAAPGEGKTLTAANLAATFAYEGLRVLLVDCDIRRPRLHGLFRVPRAPGLMELLNAPDPDTRMSTAMVDGVIRATPVKGLSLLPCGSLPTDPSTLLSGSRMRTLLQELGQTFDLVVLDTPPVLATADAGILGALADGVLLVVRAGQTDREAARRAQQQLSHVGARVVGAVLNDPGGEVALEGDYYYPYDYAAE